MRITPPSRTVSLFDTSLKLLLIAIANKSRSYLNNPAITNTRSSISLIRLRQVDRESLNGSICLNISHADSLSSQLTIHT
jgi:hypothetical protein